MSLKKIDYKDARKLMKPGDVIAFSGNSFFSEIIKLATFSNISHVGVILQTQVFNDGSGRFFNKVIESATVHGFSGVNDNRLSERLNEFDGDIWWLPLKKELRKERFNETLFFNFLFDQEKARKEYDLPQALLSALDIFDKLPFAADELGRNKEDFSKFFCSELVAAGFEKSGIIGDINASEVTPIELCRWNIYEDDYYLIKGNTTKEISRYNSTPPKG